jgi:hypothetical protein
MNEREAKHSRKGPAFIGSLIVGIVTLGFVTILADSLGKTATPLH